MLFHNRFDLDHNVEFLTSIFIFAQNLLINILFFYTIQSPAYENSLGLFYRLELYIG